jgi:hypothetical protein
VDISIVSVDAEIAISNEVTPAAPDFAAMLASIEIDADFDVVTDGRLDQAAMETVSSKIPIYNLIFRPLCLDDGKTECQDCATGNGNTSH